jgi:methionine synthase II (cobalamin-independent)
MLKLKFKSKVQFCYAKLRSIGQYSPQIQVKVSVLEFERPEMAAEFSNYSP